MKARDHERIVNDIVAKYAAQLVEMKEEIKALQAGIESRERLIADLADENDYLRSLEPERAEAPNA